MKELMGLAVLAWPLVLMVAFVLVFTLAVAGTYQATRKQKSGWKWPLGVALVLYLAVFWDHIPTVLAHKYYCETEAGFWVFKTPEQWKKENPGVMETLVANKGYPSSHEGDMANYTTTNFLNPRFNLVVQHHGPLFLHRWRREDALVDTKTNEILARYVDFSTSQYRRQAGWSGWKSWLDTRQCIGGLDKAIESGNFVNQFRGTGK